MDNFNVGVASPVSSPNMSHMSQPPFPANYQTDNRDELIWRKTMDETNKINEGKKKKLLSFKKRTKLPFKIRVLIFAVLLTVSLFAFFVSFATGSDIGSAFNNITDNIMTMFSEWLFGVLGFLFGRDLSNAAVPMVRLVTLGPISVVLVLSFISLVISGIIALIWSYFHTRSSINDGTPNIQVEQLQITDAERQYMQQQMQEEEMLANMTEFDRNNYIYNKALNKFLERGQNRAQADIAAKREVTMYNAKHGYLNTAVVSNINSDNIDDLRVIANDANIPYV